MARYDDDEEYEEQSDRRRRTDRDDDESREQALRRRLRQRTASVGSDEDDDVEFYELPRGSRAGQRQTGYAQPQIVYAQPTTPAYPRGGCAATMLYTILGVLSVVLIAILVLPRLGFNLNLGDRVPSSVAQVIASPTPTVRDRGGTIQQIRNLNRLETQSVQIERVIEAGITGNALQELFFGDRLLLIASGSVVAGVDLSRLTANDIEVSPDGEQITITLPPSEVFSASLDNGRTRVYDRQRGWLAVPDKDLETRARQEAESQILTAACEVNINQKAAEEAKRSLEQFLSLLDFSQVTVNARIGECVAPAAPNQVTQPNP